jgi:cytochrome bd-type quinol oxidase subunit 2
MKKIIYGLALAILVSPSFALGQWSEGYNMASSSGVPDGGILDIVTNIMDWLLILLGIFGIIGFVVSGILYLTAAGNDDRMESAKKAMYWSILGVIVGIVGFVVIKAADAMLSGTSSTF